MTSLQGGRTSLAQRPTRVPLRGSPLSKDTLRMPSGRDRTLRLSSPVLGGLYRRNGTGRRVVVHTPEGDFPQTDLLGPSLEWRSELLHRRETVNRTEGSGGTPTFSDDPQLYMTGSETMERSIICWTMTRGEFFDKRERQRHVEQESRNPH